MKTITNNIISIVALLLLSIIFVALLKLSMDFYINELTEAKKEYSNNYNRLSHYCYNNDLIIKSYVENKFEGYEETCIEHDFYNRSKCLKYILIKQ